MDFISAFDRLVPTLMDSLRCPFLDRFMVFFSAIGNMAIIWFLLIAILLLSKHYRYYGVAALISLALCVLIVNVVLKPLFDCPRPFEVMGGFQLLIPPPLDSSFPSGHAASSFAVAACIFAARKKAGVFALILATLIAFSRLYLNVHFASDVVVGTLVGCACALVALLFKRFVINRIPRLRA